MTLTNSIVTYKTKGVIFVHLILDNSCDNHYSSFFIG